jgi:uncharacterized protein YjiS (DUF1127 family)
MEIEMDMAAEALLRFRSRMPLHLRLVPAFLRGALIRRHQARELREAVARLADLSGHLLADIGVVEEPARVTDPDRLLAPLETRPAPAAARPAAARRPAPAWRPHLPQGHAIPAE